jgi:ankyrin repeat protein
MYSANEVMQAMDRAFDKYGFCPNRVWALAISHPEKEQIIPSLCPPRDTEHPKASGTHHARCTVDFCERSQINYTSAPQRHESPHCERYPCKTLKGLFPGDVLNQAASEDPSNEEYSTAWQLHGRRMVRLSNQSFMAISHVWSDGTGAGMRPSDGVNICLYQFFSHLARTLKCDGIWWDSICVPSDRVARAKAINNMHLNYGKAAYTLVHDCFLRDTEFDNPEAACIAIIMSPWFSRGWTALELAASKNVKIVFKQSKERNGITLVDLDKLLDGAKTGRYRIAAEVIKNVRKPLTDLNQLLRIVKARHTSWSRDMAVISELLTRTSLQPAEYKQTDEPDCLDQHDIHVKIFQTLKTISYGHLFHNLPTTANGASWCPAHLTSLPISSTDPAGILHFTKNAGVVGKWKVLKMEWLQNREYEIRNAHPLVELKLRAILGSEQSPKHSSYQLLAEPLLEVRRLLVVQMLRPSTQPDVCQLVGFLDLCESHPLEPSDYNDEDVTIVSAGKRACTPINGLRYSKKIAEDASSIVNQASCRRGRLPINVEKDIDLDLSAPLIHFRYDEGIENSKMKPDNNTEAARASQPGIPTVYYSSSKTLAENSYRYSWHPDSSEADNKTQMRQLPAWPDPDADGRTAISHAAGNGKTELLENHLDIFARHMYRSCADQERGDSTSSVDEAAKQFRIHCNLADKDGRTPLSWAAGNGQKETVRLLLNYPEVDIEAKASNGWTALRYAVRNKDIVVMRLLLDAGARKDIAGREMPTLLHLLVRSDQSENKVVELLLKAGDATRNEKDKRGRTPLSWAAERGYDTVVEKLLQMVMLTLTCRITVDGVR